jgi:hypothetical protein
MTSSLPNYELANPSPVTLAQIVDDVQTYTDTIEIVEANRDKLLKESAPSEHQFEIQQLNDDIAQLLARRDAIGMALADKTDAIAAVLRRMEAEEQLIKSEEARLHGRRKTLESAGKWLRGYVLSVMQRNGVKQLKTTTNTLFPRGSEAVVILDEAKVPPQYKRVTVTIPLWLWQQVQMWSTDIPSANAAVKLVRPVEDIPLTPIKQAIKAGEDVPGADLQFNTSLVVR